ncbi:O-antigen ligase family protein [Pararhizobium sp. O133]|uniref:O-antigen ligase family protein n=1 Tax=Pararhizobium sp. O133 TaxID=3449278 RepID=UPI003F68262A
MIIKRSLIFSIGFVLFFAYAMPLRWIDIDNQAFEKISSATYGGELIGKQIGAALLALFLLVVLPFIPRALQIIPRGFFAAAALPYMSLIWSIDPLRTFNALIVLTLTVLMSAMAVRMYGVQETVRRFWALSVLVMLVSVALAVIGDPHVMMFSTHAGLWRGLMNHKNTFAPFVSVILLMTIFGGEILQRGKLARAAVSLLCLLCLHMASSSATTVATAAALGVGMLANIRLKSVAVRTTIYGLGILATIGVASIVIANLDDFAALAGRDITLTGRTSLWQAALPFTYQAPFGYGFATAGGTDIVNAMKALSGWDYANSTHNIYISRALDVGWIGVALMLLWVVPMIMVVDPSRMRTEKTMLAAVATLHLVGGLAEAIGLLYTNAAFTLMLILSSGLRMKDAAPLMKAEVQDIPAGDTIRSAAIARV